MFKKRIKYVDFNGTEREEDFYFHMSSVEMTRFEASLRGMTVEDYAKGIDADKNAPEAVRFIEDIILNSYGRKSPDGRTFLKSPEIRQEFEYSQAYAELFEEMILNPESAKKFAMGVGEKTKGSDNVSPINRG